MIVPSVYNQKEWFFDLYLCNLDKVAIFLRQNSDDDCIEKEERDDENDNGNKGRCKDKLPVFKRVSWQALVGKK